MRIARFDSATPRSPPVDVRRARELPAGVEMHAGRSGASGRAERIGPAPYGVARMLSLYLENERPYVPPVVSSFRYSV